MKKEFVTCEQALELKELGCDEDCLGYYNIDPYLPNPTFNLIRPFEHEWCLPAPTKSHALRWFREEYNLISHVKPLNYGCDLKTNKFVYELTEKIGTSSYDIYDTYEEAENACIDKIIELVRQSLKKEEQEVCRNCGKTLREQMKGCSEITCYRQFLPKQQDNDTTSDNLDL